MSDLSAGMGVSITAFRSEPYIAGCLTSLFASEGARLRVVVIDNASEDGTLAAVRRWAEDNSARVTFAESEVGGMERASADLTLLRSPVNTGFAAATNRGLEVLLADPALNLFWVLNPDCQALPDTAARFITAAREGPFSLMGGRTVYIARPDLVQTDGGRVSLTTGVVTSINNTVPVARARMPAAGEIDFITGACCVASRQFIEQAGLMPEDYFVYYEEVEWAFRRGALPLRQVPEAVVLHHGGTTIGTGSFNRRPSAFANYFNYRNRMRFMRRFAPLRLPAAFAYALAKGVQLALIGARGEAHAVFAGVLGLAPPGTVRAHIGPAAQAVAFGPRTQ